MENYLDCSEVNFMKLNFQIFNLMEYRKNNLIKLDKSKSRGSASEENN